jgi:sugar phosphate isomerase/epimerase
MGFMGESFRVAAVTDEFAPDLAAAIRSMAAIGMGGAELRTLSGRNVVDLSNEELDEAVATVRDSGLEIVSIASPLLKCILPDAPELDSRFQQDAFSSNHTFADQPRLAARTFEIAGRAGARIVRVFSYWRTVRPEECFGRIVEALARLAEEAASCGLIVGVENEHACNISTGWETARLLAALDCPNLGVVWDPGNALVAGETPFPEGYGCLLPARIAHVHAKDCLYQEGKLVWGELGEGVIDWRGQVRALWRDGYRGWLSLETHWSGPDGDKHQASRICGRNLMALARVIE